MKNGLSPQQLSDFHLWFFHKNEGYEAKSTRPATSLTPLGL